MASPARLLTAQQVADDFGLPSAGTLRSMRCQGLPAVKIGKAWLFDADDVSAFIQSRKVTQCPAPILAPGSNPSLGVRLSTSSGLTAGGSGPAALARQTAERLKRGSRNSCGSVNLPTALPVQPIRGVTQ